MMRYLGVVALVLTLAGADAAEQNPVLVYPCERVETAPVVDGRLDDAAWQKAPLVSGFTYYNRHELTPVQTAFRAVYDAQALYLGVRCDEPLWEKMTAGTPGMRDGHSAVFAAEAIEVFLDPGHDHSNYYQIAVNSDGTIFDGRGSDASWNGKAAAAGSISQGGWSLEVMVPWADFGFRPEPGKVVGLNLCRDRNIAPAKEWTTWSQIDANFHDPLHFGHLVLSATPEVIGRLSDEFRKGGLQGSIQVFGAEGFSGTTYLALASRSLQALDTALAEMDAIRGRESSTVVAAALGKRIADARATLAPIAEKVKEGKAFDAAEWLHADGTMQKLRTDLEKALWEARLDALLSTI